MFLSVFKNKPYRNACFIAVSRIVLAIFIFLSSQIAVKANEPIGSIGGLITGAIRGQDTGLPLPRFVSLKGKRTNMRIGPSFDHKINWVYVKKGLPVEVIEEFEVWRKIRDVEGQEGWVHKALLSSRRRAIIAPQAKGEYFPLWKKAEEASPIVARLESGVFAMVEKCEQKWCQIKGEQFKGWLKAENLWGVYLDEVVE